MALRSMNAPGVALVGVADDVLRRRLLMAVSLPLEAGRETRAAAAAQAGLLDLVDHLLRRHLGEHLRQRLVAAQGQVVVDVLRVDDAAVAQRDPHLLAEEVRVAEDTEEPVVQVVLLYHQPRDRLALDQMLLDDLRHIVFGTLPYMV